MGNTPLKVPYNMDMQYCFEGILKRYQMGKLFKNNKKKCGYCHKLRQIMINCNSGESIDIILQNVSEKIRKVGDKKSHYCYFELDLQNIPQWLFEQLSWDDFSSISFGLVGPWKFKVKNIDIDSGQNILLAIYPIDAMELYYMSLRMMNSKYSLDAENNVKINYANKVIELNVQNSKSKNEEINNETSNMNYELNKIHVCRKIYLDYIKDIRTIILANGLLL